MRNTDGEEEEREIQKKGKKARLVPTEKKMCFGFLEDQNFV